MTCKEIIDKGESSSQVSEPVMVTYVAEAPARVMHADEIKAYCREHLPSDFLAELEANNFYLDRDIPLDAMPQSIDEWMYMAAESEASGWLTEQEFLDHASRWSHM